MSVEVELKAWVDNPEITEEAIRSRCSYVGEYTKIDRYFRAPLAVEGVIRALRVRIQNGAALVTYKDKTVRDGIEVNDEREFEVSDAGMFVDLLRQSGFEEFGTKEKRGAHYDCDGTVVELSVIAGLGTFIEVETVIDSSDDSEIEAARRTVLDVFRACGGDESRIEPQPYLALLGFI